MAEQKTEQAEDLPTALLHERDRVRDVVKPNYVSLGYAGSFALKITINPALEVADAALTEADAAGMVIALRLLRDIKD